MRKAAQHIKVNEVSSWWAKEIFTLKLVLATARSWREDRVMDQPKVPPHEAQLAPQLLCGNWQGGGSERRAECCSPGLGVWMNCVYSLCLVYHDAFVCLRLFPLLLLFVFREATNCSNIEVDIRSSGLWIRKWSPLQGLELSETITVQRWKHCAFSQRKTGL